MALAWASAGCGLVTLSHDAVLGPVSPAGRIHAATIGRDFRVTRTGPVANSAQEPRFRPYPADLVRRLGSPGSFRALLQGFQAFASGMSLVVDRREQLGSPHELEDVPGKESTLQQVLEQLGAPQVWVRREGGSVVYYRSRSIHDLSLNLGIPPLAAGLVPVPGVASLALRLTSLQDDVSGIVLFFDVEDRLEGVALQTESSP